MKLTNLCSRLSVATAATALLLAGGCVVEDPDANADANDNDNGGPVDTDFDCSAVGELSSNITDDTTFTPDDNDCLLVTANIEVESGAHLTIEPGVVLQFEAGVGLNVRGGTMSAEGTADDPILFTATEQQSGWWRGVQFRDTLSSNNKLDHVIIEYGGHDDTFYRTEPANLMLNDQSGNPQVAIDNVTLQHSGDVGLYVDSGARITSFENNTLTGNDDYAASIHTSHIDMLSDSSSFSGNDDDYVQIRGGTITDGDHTWPAIDVPYLVTGGVDVEDDAHVDVDPGAEFRFAEGEGLSIREGTMSVNGTEEEPVLFSALEEQPGWWRGIQFRDTRSAHNQLDYAIIEYGGHSDTFYRASPANLALNTQSGDPELAITNTVLRHSETVGLYAEDGSRISSFDNNTLTENTGGAARIKTSHLGMINNSSSFSGNDYDHVLVNGGTITSDDHTWPAIDVSYAVTSDMNVEGSAHVDIAGGAHFEFRENVGLNVREGTLTADGSDDTIEFSALDEDLPEYWRGIQYRDTRSVNNRLEGVRIEGAASSDTFYRAPAPAGLMLNDQSGDVELSLADVEIVDFGSGAAVGVDSGFTLASCSGLSGFGAGDVEGDGADDFISACGL